MAVIRQVQKLGNFFDKLYSVHVNLNFVSFYLTVWPQIKRILVLIHLFV